MVRLKAALVIFLISLVAQHDGYRILSIYPYEGRSHFIMLRAVSIALAKAGHQVDVISHYPLEKPLKNYRDIVDLTGSRPQISGNMTLEFVFKLANNIVPTITQHFGDELCELIGHEKMRHFMENLSKMGPYDAVITEAFGAQCYLIFGHYFKAPTIVISTTMSPAWIDHITRNPPCLAYTSYSYYKYSNDFNYLSFWSRLQNTYNYLKTVYQFICMTENQNEVIRKYFGSDIPDLRTLESNIALTLVNSHYSMFGVRPFLPSVIPVGGIHILESDIVMPADLKQWMDECLNGVVFFSLGSLVGFEPLPVESIRTFFKSFSKLAPTKVLMKVNKLELVTEKVPKNVRMQRWIPQLPVLGHNHTKLFITHGGALSVMEALYYGVPMIGIPFFGDQSRNIYFGASKNFTIPLPFDRISETTLDDALNTILRDPKYKNAAKRTSHLFWDRPSNASETAIYWVEYIIRNGASSLRTVAVELYWWQNELLDIYLFTLAMVIILLYLCQRVLKRFFSRRKSFTEKKLQ